MVLSKNLFFNKLITETPIKISLLIFIFFFFLQSNSIIAANVYGGNESDIQAALDAIPTNGGDRNIYLHNSFSKLNKQVNIQKNNIQIIGINNPTLNNIVFLIDANNVTIDGLTISGTNQGECITIGNFNLIPGSDYNLSESNTQNTCHNNTVKNCTFNNLFSQQDEAGAIIRILPFKDNHGNEIISNTFINWGNNQTGSHTIKVGAARLHESGNYNGHPVFSQITTISGNTIIGNTWSKPGTSSSAIQLYNPTQVIDNIITTAFAGVSTKGSDNLIKNNTFDDIYGDGALYMRDGNKNVFEDNLVKNSKSGFYAWSGKQTIFRNNVFVENERCGTILAAKHVGDRSANWNMSNNPQWFTGQTSHQFTNDETLFENNTFYKNDFGIQWDIWAPTGSNFNKPSKMYFVNNIFWADGDNFRDKLFTKWDSGNPSDQGYQPTDQANTNSIFLFHNLFYNGFNGNIPSALNGGSSNNNTASYQPCETAHPYSPLSDALTNGLTNPSSIPGFITVHGNLTFKTWTGACLIGDCSNTNCGCGSCRLANPFSNETLKRIIVFSKNQFHNNIPEFQKWYISNENEIINLLERRKNPQSQKLNEQVAQLKQKFAYRIYKAFVLNEKEIFNKEDIQLIDDLVSNYSNASKSYATKNYLDKVSRILPVMLGKEFKEALIAFDEATIFEDAEISLKNFELIDDNLINHDLIQSSGLSKIFKYNLKHKGELLLQLFNAEGKLVDTMINSKVSEGYYQEEINMHNMPYGIYYINGLFFSEYGTENFAVKIINTH